MIIIGEKINATRKAVKEMILERRDDRLVALARRQAEAGAAYIDINVGTGTGTQADEIAAMRWAVDAVKTAVGKPICVDSADPAVLAAGLEACAGHSALINSVKADDTHLAEVLPIAAGHRVPVIALAMDQGGIPKEVKGRLAACRTIADAAARHGVPLDDLFFDPLVLPIATDGTQARVTLDTLAAVKAQLPRARTVMGLSNVSYGLPARARMNAAFLGMALYAGLDAAIMDPMDSVMTAAALTGEALMGRDRHFRKYTRAFRNA
jgi:5-methyltetrahydrofolate corrinoid/iron sulfur protein methyltransferase